MEVPIQPGMVHQDLQPAAHKQDDEEKIDIMGDAQPGRKAGGSHCISWFGQDRIVEDWQTQGCPLNICGSDCQDRQRGQRDQCFALNMHGCRGAWDVWLRLAALDDLLQDDRLIVFLVVGAVEKRHRVRFRFFFH